MSMRTFFVLAAIATMVPVAALAANPAADAFSAAMDRMMAGMHVEPSGDPDRDFAVTMIPHHQGAIDMAKAELQYGDDPELRALAETIIKAQGAEIAGLRAWIERNPE
jgi:uncharacterized protein (DUF305 family)